MRIALSLWDSHRNVGMLTSRSAEGGDCDATHNIWGSWHLKRFILLALGILAAVALVATACGGDDDSTSTPKATTTAPAGASATASTAPKELKTVTLGYIPILIDAPFFVGIERGYFADEGIKIDLQRLAGGADMLVQTAAGNFNVGSGGIGAAAFNAAGASIAQGRAVPFQIFAPLHYEKPPVTTPLVVSKTRFESGELTKVADLKGKKVAINAKGASTEYWLYKALAQGGLKYTDVQLVTVAFADVPAALQNKSIDGAMLGEPVATQATDSGMVKVLTNDFVDGDQPTGVYWNRDWAKKNPELSQGFLKAYLRSVKDLQGDGWKDPQILTILEKYTSVPADIIKRASRPYFDPNGTINLDSFHKQEQFFRDQGSLTYEKNLDFSLFIGTTP